MEVDFHDKAKAGEEACLIRVTIAPVDANEFFIFCDFVNCSASCVCMVGPVVVKTVVFTIQEIYPYKEVCALVCLDTSNFTRIKSDLFAIGVCRTFFSK